MAVWTFDPYHTQVEFSAKHLGMMTVRGHFSEVTGTGELHPEAPERSRFEISIKTDSIQTHNAQRDVDLRSSNFLETAKYPIIAFRSTKIEPAGSDRFMITGDLTIKGNTHAFTLSAINLGEFNDPKMGHRIGYSAEGTIDRKDFGMNFDMMLDHRLIVSHEIKVQIEGELVEAAAA